MKAIVRKIRKYRNLFLRITDIFIIIFSYYFAEVLINNSFIIESYINLRIINTSIVAIIVYGVFLQIFQTYKNITRYENGNDYIVYVVACVLSCLSTCVLKGFFDINIAGMRTSIIAGLMITTLLVGYRIILRFVLNKENPVIGKRNRDEENKENVLIIGAGEATRILLKTLRTTLRDKYNVIGLIDDNKNKINYAISGIKILGTRKKIIEICEKDNIKTIFFTISNIDDKQRKQILNICQETNAKVKVLPGTTDLIKGKDLMSNFRDVEIEDLLGRDPIKLDNNNIKNLINGKVVLVTGGGGSIGSELCRQIARHNPQTLVIFDIYENNLYNIELELRRKYPKLDIKGIIGSVRDTKKMDKLFEIYKPYLVFHAAAHKHVPLMEVSPLEAIKNNVFGTYNVANCSDKYGAKRCILISTDKAVNPTNIMGATKRMCEMIIQAKGKTSKTEFAAVRFGNVLGSNGSVVPLFKEQIKHGGPVTVTHKEITRFFMTIPEAVELVLQAMTYAKDGEIFVLDMGEPVKIYDLAVSLIKLSGLEPDVDIPIEITGLRPGEKLYEELLMGEEGLEHTEHSKIFVAEPLDILVEEVSRRLDILKELISSEDHTFKEIKNTVKEAVPTFAEPEERNYIVKNYKREIEKRKVLDNIDDDDDDVDELALNLKGI